MREEGQEGSGHSTERGQQQQRQQVALSAAKAPEEGKPAGRRSLWKESGFANSERLRLCPSTAVSACVSTRVCSSPSSFATRADFSALRPPVAWTVWAFPFSSSPSLCPRS